MIPSDVITLDDDREYLLVEEYEYEDNKYFLAIGLLADGNLNSKDYKFFLHTNENDEDYVEEVQDENMLKTLTGMLGIDVILEADPKNVDELDKFFEKYKEEGSF